MKYSQLVVAWDILHLKDTGSIGLSDLEKALEAVGVVIENDIPTCQPGLPAVATEPR